MTIDYLLPASDIHRLSAGKNALLGSRVGDFLD